MDIKTKTYDTGKFMLSQDVFGNKSWKTMSPCLINGKWRNMQHKIWYLNEFTFDSNNATLGAIILLIGTQRGILDYKNFTGFIIYYNFCSEI